MSTRIVHCLKLNCQAPGLREPPFPGELGQQIYEKISLAVWLEWRDQVQIKVINEYRLNLADPQHFQIFIEQMYAYLNLDENKEILEVGNKDKGRE